jgi:hypothetical protein
MKTYGRVMAKLHAFLTLLLDGSEWPASCPSHFTSGKTALGTHQVGGWVGYRVGLDIVVKRKLFCPPARNQMIPWTSCLKSSG